jgi:ABC-type phosphate transport system substrate-binding protein
MNSLSRRLLTFAIVLAAITQQGAARAGRQLAIVVNRASPTSSLTADGVKAYFLKQHKEWPSGQKVRPVQQEGPEHAVFLSRVLKMSSADYERYWLERKYAAAETPPKTVEDADAVVKFVGAINGAIGYVDASALDEKARSKLRVIHVVSY